MIETTDKVPVLGDVPGLGRLFRYDTASLQKRNLMVFLRPVIVRDSAVAQSLTHSKYSYIRDQQVAEQNRRGRLDVGDGVPILPDWNYLLTLPPPFENAMQGTPPASISAPPAASGD